MVLGIRSVGIVLSPVLRENIRRQLKAHCGCLHPIRIVLQGHSEGMLRQFLLVPLQRAALVPCG